MKSKILTIIGAIIAGGVGIAFMSSQAADALVSTN
jgi:hypothetical protein